MATLNIITHTITDCMRASQTGYT